MNIAINGFGRIGRAFFRAILAAQNTALKVVAINVGPADPDTIVYAIKYDTFLGTYNGNIDYKNTLLTINGQHIKIIAQPDANKLPWKEINVDWVVDASGAFTEKKDAQKHLVAGAKNVLITAPAHGADMIIIPGVNDGDYDPLNHRIVSLGSCTTNALLPVLKVLNDAYHIESAFMTTTHAYTNSQKLLDVNPSQKDVRRSRAAAVNIVPTSTGAMKVVGDIIPELKDKVCGFALRVPVPVVSFLEVTFLAKTIARTDDLNALFIDKSKNSLKGILDVIDVPLVSHDFALNSHSIVVDATLTQTCGLLGKICGWYDNEWGYSMRLKDFLEHAKKE